MRNLLLMLSVLGVALLSTTAAHADPAFVTFQGTLATEQFNIGGSPSYTTAGSFTGSYGPTTNDSAILIIQGVTFDLDEFSQDDSGVYFADATGDSLNLYFFQGLGLSTSPFCSTSNCPSGPSTFSQGPFSDYSVTDSTASFTIVPAAAVTPEPSSFILLGTGVLGLGGLVRRRFFS